jgi:hypothetical protein
LEDLRKLPEDIITEFLGVCYECGEPLAHVEDGLLCCTSCGREYNDGGNIEGRIPISEESSADGHAESHWSPQSMLAFAKGLGTNDRIPNSAMCRVIATSHDHDGHAVCPSCQKELPGEIGLRATQIRILTNKVDHPDIQNMLNFASQLCNEYGMHNRDRSCLVFAEDLGRWVRAVGTVCILRNDPYENRRGLVRAAFYELFKLYFGGEAAVGRLWDELKLDVDSCSYVKHLADQYQLRLKSRPFDAKFLEPLFMAGCSLIRLHKLETDDNFLQSYSKILWQIGLALLVHGYEENELIAKVAIVLTAEKLWGREKASELMTSLDISERMLGEVNILVGQKPSFSK